jgi:phosphate:Na+ symporter
VHLLTAIIQSSSASVGILQALCVTGAINFSVALPIIMGQNIGTCITAILSCIGTSKNAKRTALVHLYFNLIGTIIFMTVYYGINAFVHFSFADQVASPAGIAVIHSIFNVFATLILLPFSKVLVKLAYLTIKEDTKEAEVSKVDADFLMLDPRFLETPGFALEQCKVVTARMAEWAQKGLQSSMELLDQFDETKYQEIFTIENCVDQYEDRLGTYLVKLSAKNLSEKDSRTLSILLHCIGDFERISDHSINIAESYKEMFDKKLTFSDKAIKELEILNRAVSDIIECSVRAFKEEDLELARKVEPIEEVIDLLKFEIKKRHTKRLQKGKCTIELGFVLTDLITNLERVSDHCSNIAVFILQIKETAFDTHEYLEMVKRKDNDDFNMRYELYKQRYMLP